MSVQESPVEFWVDSLASRQTIGKEHSHVRQKKFGLKIHWAWSSPSEKDPAFPTVSLSNQEDSISILSLFIRGQTEWKPQSQKTKLITWTTTLSNSVKQWVAPCRATQDGVEFWINVVHWRKEWQTTSVFLTLDHWKSKTVPEKHLLLLYWLYQNFDCADHNKLWKILQEMGIPGHLSCLLRNLYAGQEATIGTLYGTMGWFKIGKGVQGCIVILLI